MRVGYLLLAVGVVGSIFFVIYLRKKQEDRVYPPVTNVNPLALNPDGSCIRSDCQPSRCAPEVFGGCNPPKDFGSGVKWVVSGIPRLLGR